VHVLSVVGARPQFVKLAPVDRALRELGHDHTIIHTGQHYDPGLSDQFFDDLEIPAPDRNLAVGSGTHGEQTARMLMALEPVLATARADWVLLYGDTNSTLAGALAASKLHQPCGHLEAGLRSYNREMPEELNRVLTDHACDLLLAPTLTAFENLEREDLGARTRIVGDVMIDVLEVVRRRISAEPQPLPGGLGEQEFAFCTIHRAENTDDPARLKAIVAGLRRLSRPILLAAHPRLRERAARAGVELDACQVRLLPPLSYPEVVRTMLAARAVVTDSGGLQKESFYLGTPCTTVRPETEWPETLNGGMNVLAEPEDLADDLVFRLVRPPDADSAPFGSGRAAEHAVRVLEEATVTR
jgi:UDP-N-acetylglucosamine 2-epimerase (non-hydrolysing)